MQERWEPEAASVEPSVDRLTTYHFLNANLANRPSSICDSATLRRHVHRICRPVIFVGRTLFNNSLFMQTPLDIQELPRGKESIVSSKEQWPRIAKIYVSFQRDSILREAWRPPIRPFHLIPGPFVTRKLNYSIFASTIRDIQAVTKLFNACA